MPKDRGEKLLNAEGAEKPRRVRREKVFTAKFAKKSREERKENLIFCKTTLVRLRDLCESLRALCG
jgi:hypothetical protein